MPLLLSFYVAVIAGGLVAWLGDGSSGHKRLFRVALQVASLLALAWTFGTVVWVGMFPTVDKIQPGTRPLREFLEAFSEFIVVLFPLWGSLTYYFFFIRRGDSVNRRFWRAAGLVFILLPVDVLISLWVGCNLAGACL